MPTEDWSAFRGMDVAPYASNSFSYKKFKLCLISAKATCLQALKRRHSKSAAFWLSRLLARFRFCDG